MVRQLRAISMVLAVAGLSASGALAQTSQPTPLTGIPTVPKTLPVIGGGLFPSQNLNVATASAIDRPDYVNYLISTGDSPDETDKDGRTGLIYAAMSNYADIVQTLISHAAKLDMRDKFGYTALHWAAERGNVVVMKLLLGAKAVVDPQNAQGITPLMLATSSGNMPAVRLLLQNRADPHKQDYTGRDAFGWAGNHTAIVALLNDATSH